MEWPKTGYSSRQGAIGAVAVADMRTIYRHIAPARAGYFPLTRARSSTCSAAPHPVGSDRTHGPALRPVRPPRVAQLPRLLARADRPPGPPRAGEPAGGPRPPAHRVGLSPPQLVAGRTVPAPMGFSRQEYQSGVPLPSLEMS